jgi:hypothetical protein
VKQSKMLFGLAVCLFMLIGCDINDGTLEIDDEEIVIPPSNTVPSTSKSTLPAELQWLHQNAESNKEYIIELTGSGNIGAQDLAFPYASDVTIRLIGKERERIIQLTDNGRLFGIGSGVTLIIGNNVTLKGHARNNTAFISVYSRGTLIMESGAKISGNTNTQYNGTSGVYVNMDGSFFMKGGEISGMGGGSYAAVGGVCIGDGGYFKMENGKITDNSASVGGVGVNDGWFIMTGGEISGNTSSGHGGGVYMWNGIFDMEGGKIFGNKVGSNSNGGGVYVSNAVFTMKSGEIFGNTANSGGGVYVTNNASMSKTGGIIYGYVLGDNQRNTATAGITSNDKGHAVFVGSSPGKRRETTAGSGVNLDSGVSGAAGGWE